MKATHTEYMHPKHLRVVDGQKHKGYSAALEATTGNGFYEDDAICMAPSCADYARLNKSGLPKWQGK